MANPLNQKSRDHIIANISTRDYSYILSPEKIAKYPLKKRDHSNLLIYRNSSIIKDKFKNIFEHLDKNSLLIFNNTKVIQARIIFYKDTGAKIEVFCLEPSDPHDYTLVFLQQEKCRWKCIIGNLKKWKTGTLTSKFFCRNKEIILTADKIKTDREYSEVLFQWNDNNTTFGELLDCVGLTPIPPYLNRNSETSDKERYQTVYSRTLGSVAAPTSGLHFTSSLLEKLCSSNIKHTEITLHIGTGTFLPIKSDSVRNHIMHSEHFEISEYSVNQIINNKHNIIAIGTTSVRTIESVYWLGVKILEGKIKNQKDLFIKQWDAYELRQDISPDESLTEILKYMRFNKLNELGAITRMMIVPGYRYRLLKGLVTNFHLPKSSLLLLIASFIGDNWRKVYDFALNNNFRFLSYGDSSLLFRE